MYNLLVCDDEADIVSALDIYLSGEGYSVFGAHGGQEALDIIEREDIHLILLDVMMPGIDGLEVVKRVRAHSNVPIILLTAKSEERDKVDGLNIGADDYITKPFGPDELLARVRSVLRRYTTLGACAQQESESVLCVGGIVLDDTRRHVELDGEEVILTNAEYEILKLLMKNPGKVFSTKEIWRSVWQSEPVGEKNTIAVHIHHLREKLEIVPSDPRYLKVVWAQGYKIEDGGKR